MPIDRATSIQSLQRAFQHHNLALFLGAGVSVSNKLPSWEKLVLSMYFSTISEQKLGGWRPFSNYLYAISEWYLNNMDEPLEITARKLRKYYKKDADGNERFLANLYHNLYGHFLTPDCEILPEVTKDMLRGANSTLDAVAKLCESPEQGVKSVITYNYDNLLELVLEQRAHQSIFSPSFERNNKLPIYHVHGYVPLHKKELASLVDEIVFTEDQYHHVLGNSYHWSNIVQLHAMSNSVGLMIGLSLSDRNIRRLLDAVRSAPIGATIYAILPVPNEDPPSVEELDNIQKNAIEYLKDFERSGIKSAASYEDQVFFQQPGIKSAGPNIKSSFAGQKGPRYRHEIAGIINEVKYHVKDQQQFVLEQLGITPIWIKSFDEIPEILREIGGG